MYNVLVAAPVSRIRRKGDVQRVACVFTLTLLDYILGAYTNVMTSANMNPNNMESDLKLVREKVENNGENVDQLPSAVQHCAAQYAFRAVPF